MTADKNTPKNDQLIGVADKIEKGVIEELIKLKPTPKCKANHRDLKSGERCKECNSIKF